MRILLKVVIGGAAALCCACGETSTAPESRVVVSRTIRVPSQAATIQAALDASRDGDIILVSSGVYSGDGNCDIDFSGKSVALISEAGPRTTIIDCAGDSSEPHFGILLAGGEDNAIVDGFTIRNGSANHGAAISLLSSSPTIKNCVFWNNHATVSGGAVRLKNSSAQFINCTFRDNSAPNGGGMFLIAGSSPIVENCIIANSTIGGAVFVSGSTCNPEFSCTTLFGNNGGDWTDAIAHQETMSGNLSLDPRFCETGSEVGIPENSPCAPANNSCGVLIGAVSVTCAEFQPGSSTSQRNCFD